MLIESIQNWTSANPITYNEKDNTYDQNVDLNRNNQSQQSQRPGPNEVKLREILDRTGYTHEVSSGQRKYGGPPPALEGEQAIEDMAGQTDSTENKNTVCLKQAPAGCECFVGKLPRDLFEDELILLFEKQGRIWDLRLMIDPNSGFSKGYAFVTFCDKESAQAAAKNVSCL